MAGQTRVSIDAQQNPRDEWIMLNVGGQLFTTTRTTLCSFEPNSMLARMFSQPDHNDHDDTTDHVTTDLASSRLSALMPSPRDSNGAYLIDRSPKYFEPILNYLRHGKLIIDHNVNVQGVLEEAKFFGIVSLLPKLELETERMFKKKQIDLYDAGLIKSSTITNQLIEDGLSDQQQQKQQHPIDNRPPQPTTTTNSDATITLDSISYINSMPQLTRTDVIKALMVTTRESGCLRFQGVNLSGANLSQLDLSYINFKYANLSNCNLKGADLSYADFYRANLSKTNLEGSKIRQTNFNRANLSNSNMRAIDGSFISHDPHYVKPSSFEGANMANCNLEASRLSGSNFKDANLRGSNLQNCDISVSNFYGATLENCDLTTAVTEYTSFEGVNMKGAHR